MRIISNLPGLARIALVGTTTGWIAALYGALFIYATADFAATGSFWIFGWPFLLALTLATVTNLVLAGIGGRRAPSPIAWVNVVNGVISPGCDPDEVDHQTLATALARLPIAPIANCFCAAGLASLVTGFMAGLEWLVTGTARNVGPILLGGSIATLTYTVTNFAVGDLLVARACTRLRLAGIRRGIDPYRGPTIDTWVRVATLAAPTVLALVISSRLAADAYGSWVAQSCIVVAGSSLLAALAWLQALTIRNAAADLGEAAGRLASDGRARLITGSTDTHLIDMARAFNSAAGEVDRSLQISAARYAALFEGAGDAILIADAQTHLVLEANRRAHELTGREPDALMRTRLGSLFAEDLDLNGGALRATGRTVVRPDGSRCPVDVALSAVDVGEQTVLQAILHDVGRRHRIESDLRESVARLEGLYHLAVTLGGTVERVASYVATTLAGLLDFPLVCVARHEGAEMVALAMVDDGVVTRGRRMALAGTPCERVSEKRRACVFTDTAGAFPGDHFLAERGIETYVGVPALSSDGTVLGCVAICDTRRRDPAESDMRLLSAFAQRLARAIEEEEYGREREALVRQLTAQNAELRAAKERLTEADRLKSEFMGMMSHELRTPLNVFVGYTEMVLDAARENGDSRVRDHREVLERMLDAAHVLTDLVEDTLSVLRLESAGVRVNWEPVSLQSLFAELQAAERFFRAPSAVTESWTVECDLPPIVSDRMKLRQIVTNLVGNARKFTGVGSITVLALRSAPDEVSIRVEDTGCGIDPADRPHVFDLYRQSANGAPHNGCGIGLYIVRRYCEILGGRVELESEIGRGTCITITLPRVDHRALGRAEPAARMP